MPEPEAQRFFHQLIEGVVSFFIFRFPSILFFSPDQDVELIVGILFFKVYLHSIGVTHRDIKPENLLLDERGKRGTTVSASVLVSSSRETVLGIGGGGESVQQQNTHSVGLPSTGKRHLELGDCKIRHLDREVAFL